MMHSRWLLMTGLLLGGLGLGLPTLAPAQLAVRQANMVAVQVDQSDRAVFDGFLRIGDVAEVEADNNFLAQRVRALDLEVLTMEAPRTTISREQIEYRLLLAGVKREHIALTGFERVTVELQDIRQIMQLLATTLDEQCTAKFSTPAGFCQVSLQAEARSLLERSQINWRHVSVAAILPAELKAGEQLLPVEFYSGSVVTTLQLPVHFRFNHAAARLPVATPPTEAAAFPPAQPKPQLIPANSVFAHPDLFPAESPTAPAAMPAPAVTATPRTGQIPASDLAVRTPDIHSVRAVSYELAESGGTEVLRRAQPEMSVAEPAEVLVARNAVVRVSQRIGQVTIGLKTARAAAEGKLGDVIEVIAPYKGRDGREIRLLGKVVAENELELVR
jgi:hypothetical protein